jgi:pyrroloquinoline quinone biosynthesis protein B
LTQSAPSPDPPAATLAAPAPGQPRFLLLGTAAGGGLPQWNCDCPNCTAARAGELGPRLQSGAAFSPDGQAWYLIDASPDLGAQLSRLPAPLQRVSPVRGVVLTDAEFDHTLGLLTLREGSQWTLSATAGVHAMLADQFPVPRLLSRYAGLTLQTLTPGVPTRFGTVSLTLTALDDHTPRYHHGRRPEAGATCAVTLRGPTRTLVYAPSLSRLDGPVAHLLSGADVLLTDGTFFESDELAQLGYSQDSALSMGHLPMRESAPVLARLAPLVRYVHLNNTNPALPPHSPQRAWLRAQGLDLADDGLEIAL